MIRKLLAVIAAPEQTQTVKESGCEVLVEYPESVLVRCTQDQEENLQKAGIVTTVIEEPEFRIAGLSLPMSRVHEAEAASPIDLDPDRVAYFLVQAVGPVKGEWLEKVADLGGVVQDTLDGFVLVVGLLPGELASLVEQPWVEGVTPYRSSMKVSPKLRREERRSLSARELASSLARETTETEEGYQVEINVFRGEATEALATKVREAKGVVLSQTPTTVRALVPDRLVDELAQDTAVQSILPCSFPELHNDKAAQIMGVPDDNNFGGLTLFGDGQIVAIADSGLDSGNPTTIHRDFQGRVVDITSFPITDDIRPLSHNVMPFDDGPADLYSAHGTHVAGSVLGNGTEAMDKGQSLVPRGIAPEAKVYSQAVEQRVKWKTRKELKQEGVIVPPAMNWPPKQVGLYGLPDDLSEMFLSAYDSGARIHTNSWGGRSYGEYDQQASDLDRFVWEHPDMLILFSAGNAGKDVDEDGTIDRDSIGVPGTAKNCLTVGASENNRPRASAPPPGNDLHWNQIPRFRRLDAAGHVSDNPDGMAAFSSRGPTDDARIKPDVVAPGTNILSTRSAAWLQDPDDPRVDEPLWGDLPSTHPLEGLYCWSGGTSMSTPLVAGVAAIVREYLVRHLGHFQDNVKPSAALIKAFIINGAQRMKGQYSGEIPEGRNSINGFGRVNVSNMLDSARLPRMQFSDEPDLAVETQQTRVFKVTPANPSEPLKVTLAWTDAASLPGAGGLRNKLYLIVKTSQGVHFDGDIRPYPRPVNNVQQVVVFNPGEGEYEVHVHGFEVVSHAHNVPDGSKRRQDFALVASNAMSLAT